MKRQTTTNPEFLAAFPSFLQLAHLLDYITMPRIALAQTSPASAPSGPPALEKPHSTSPFPTLDQNLVDVVDFVERAAAEKAEVVVFPEYFLQGIVNEARQVSQHMVD